MSITNTRLLLPEYGRNVQKMVQYLKTIEDKELRNKQAEVVVGIMSTLYPGKRDTDEFKNMLWDHLFMIADFELDIDSPYQKPTLEEFNPIPERIPYGQSYIARKQYGKLAQKMVKEIAKSTEDTTEDKELAVANIAKFLKQKSFEYNNEFPDNTVIINDIRDFSDGAIELEANTLDNTQVIVKPKVIINRSGNNNKSGNSSNNNKNLIRKNIKNKSTK